MSNHKSPQWVECSTIKFYLKGLKPIIVVICYLPPQCVNAASIDYLCLYISSLKLNNSELIILGDFNIDLLKKSSLSQKFTQLMSSLNLTQVLKSPSRIATKNLGSKFTTSATLIDHIYVNSIENYEKSGLLSHSSSDHKLSYIIRNKYKEKFSTHRTISYRCYKNIDYENFEKSLCQIRWIKIFTDDSNVCLDKMTNIILAYLLY